MPDFNTDKNVYLLGAGFSKEIGLPLQDDFLLVAKEVYFKNPKMYNHFEKVFDYQNNLTKMKQFLNYPLLNLEHLFNLIEMHMFYSNSQEIANIKTDFINKYRFCISIKLNIIENCKLGLNIAYLPRLF